LGAAKAEEAQTGGEQARTNRPPRPHAPSGAEKAAHAEFVATLDDPIWGG